MTILTFRPGRDFLSMAARAAWHFLDQCDSHGEMVADAHVVVPTAAQIPGVRLALDRAAREAGGPRLLPRVLTLGHWLLDLPPDLLHGATPLRSHAARLLAVQQAVRGQDWLRRAFGAQTEPAAWGLSQTLLAVCDELSARWLEDKAIRDDDAVDAHDRAALLQGALERTYAHLSTRFLGEEARIVLAFWQALSGPGDPLPARQRALATLARHLRGPLVWLGPTPPQPVEAAFLRAAGEMVPVLQIGYDWNGAPERMEGREGNGSGQPDWYDTLLALWPECRRDRLGEGARAGGGLAHAPGPLPADRPRLRIVGSARFEDEAVAAATQLVQWLNEGRRDLALIAHDRVVARRTRALLARAGAPVRDETGWKLSTTRAAAALMRWFDLVMGDGDSAALLDLVKSPFCLPDLPSRGAALAAIEQAVRRDRITGGWQRLRQRFQAPATQNPGDAADDIAADDDAARAEQQQARRAAAMLVEQLASQAESWPRHGKAWPVAFWLQRLAQTLDALRMGPALAGDEAGRQLLEALARLDELPEDEAGQAATLTLPEFRAMLAALLESVAYKEPVEPALARITILPLNGARMRRFDGVVIVGCDDAQLPSTAAELMFFSNQMRRELDLEDREARFAQQARDLAEVLLNNDEVVMTWQRFGDRGEPRHVSGWLERLSAHCARAGERIEGNATVQLHETQARPGAMPAPPADAELVPQRWSAQAYNMLRRCPYQFFAGRMLRLAGLDEVSGELEKRDIGERLHEVLVRYHREVAQREIHGDAARTAHLRAVTDDVFGPLMAEDGNAIGYYRRWLAVLPGYVAWQGERERQGWRWRTGELDVVVELEIEGQAPVRLHGRIDRLDRHEDGRHAVLDYKTQTATRLRLKAREAREDCQLPFYGLLREDAHEGSWVALEDGRSDRRREVPLDGFADEVAWLRDQLRKDVRRLRDGVPLPAFGDAAACTYCEARGLCRKGYWESTALPAGLGEPGGAA
ncbi:PD-(D/E)XK nuclease family protein [Cupriavidus sp. AU9028]|uniref:PD-(D/E)XK nuclease family protein n=1 Tax=Cupriavidus sp. AU9028 TaxID=2871157 RepID=UPI001C95FB1B|nr:PD-(D/E)XK nuclease family protein [Cupriavidus sp. AU9028]MBY4896218.1 PD-(D/E)XK nuclease family protein [Cupriavidus sp. AU9028]